MNHDVIVSVLVALLTVSEALGTLKIFADNSIFQVVLRIVKAAYSMVSGKQAQA